MIEERTFLARAVKHKFGEADNEKRTPYVRVIFRIEQGQGPSSGLAISKDFWLSAEAYKYSAEELVTAGWIGTNLRQMPGIGSRVCNIVVEHETTDRGTFARIKYVNRAPSLDLVKKLDSSAIDEIEEKHAATMAAILAKRAGKPRAVSVPSGTEAAPMDPQGDELYPPSWDGDEPPVSPPQPEPSTKKKKGANAPEKGNQE